VSEAAKGTGGHAIPLACPELRPEDRAAVLQVLRGTQLALGPATRRFEERFADAVGRTHAVAVSSGTAALHLIVRALRIGSGDEVITSPFSFIASANCILYEQARPVFVDIEGDGWTIDPARVVEAITPRTKAILAVDVFGQPADWAALEDIAARQRLILIEDSAEALGSSLGGRRCGSFGAAAAFGFYPNKQITTGEGGMVVTDDNELAARCRSMANQGRGDGGNWLDHVRVGFNYRMSEMTAALGSSQLERLQEIVARREAVASWYAEELMGCDELVLPRSRPGAHVSWFVYVVRLAPPADRARRDRLLDGLRDAGIGCRDYFAPLHLQPVYRDAVGGKVGDFPICEAVAAGTMALPFYHALSRADVARVCEVLRRLLRTTR